MVNITKIKALAKSKGVKLVYICEKLGVKGPYFYDVEHGKTTMSDDRIYKVAEILGTTYEYLTDQIEDASAKESETWVKPASDEKQSLFDLPGVAGVDVDHQKMAQLLGMIAKKPSAKKDLDDVLTYLEFIAKRGE